MSSSDFKECTKPLCEFSNIREFFSRPIAATFRPIGQQDLVSPCDGKIIEHGKISEGTILRVKGYSYNLSELVQDDLTGLKKNNGSYINIYLSPRNYHRFHIPCDGKITQIKHIPGYCLPVNAFGRKEKKLYALNERCIVQITSQHHSVCLAIVGAAAVRGIKLFKAVGNTVKKGEELGMFELGSSIVLVTDTEIKKTKEQTQIKACEDLYLPFSVSNKF